MIRGYVVELPSSREGVPCYLLASSGLRAYDAAAVLPTEAEAEALLSDVRAALHYRAPETLSPGLVQRLDLARVVPLPDGILDMSQDVTRG